MINASFSMALAAVKIGSSIKREGWNGSGIVVKVQIPAENSKMTVPYLYIEYPTNHAKTPGLRCPWLASQTDIMAEDWEIINEQVDYVTEQMESTKDKPRMKTLPRSII
jgi:hypothetical protein